MVETPAFIVIPLIEEAPLPAPSAKKKCQPLVSTAYIITQQSESIMTETGEKANINSIVQYIDANFSDPELSLKKISDEFFFSPPYLSRIFKKAMNISPSKYIIQLRINKAKRMLQINQFKIANIAYACGYTSPYYFSLEFKRIVGMSPSKYKQKSFHIE